MSKHLRSNSRPWIGSRGGGQALIPHGKGGRMRIAFFFFREMVVRRARSAIYAATRPSHNGTPFPFSKFSYPRVSFLISISTVAIAPSTTAVVTIKMWRLPKARRLHGEGLICSCLQRSRWRSITGTTPAFLPFLSSCSVLDLAGQGCLAQTCV